MLIENATDRMQRFSHSEKSLFSLSLSPSPLLFSFSPYLVQEKPRKNSKMYMKTLIIKRAKFSKKTAKEALH